MGTALVKKSTLGTLTLEDVENIGVAGEFVVFQYADGSTVLEKGDSIQSVQFTPDAAPAEPENNGQGTDDTPTQ